MDDYDKENLIFLLNASPEIIKDWYEHIDADDREYASELLAAYSEELRIKDILLSDIEILNTAPAINVLKLYMIGGK